jgi:hypothetical protein
MVMCKTRKEKVRVFIQCIGYKHYMWKGEIVFFIFLNLLEVKFNFSYFLKNKRLSLKNIFKTFILSDPQSQKFNILFKMFVFCLLPSLV